MFYVGLIVISTIIILIFLFGEVGNDILLINTPKESKNQKSKRGTFRSELLDKSNGAFKFKHDGKIYLLKTNDSMILDTLKEGIGHNFNIEYEEKEVSSSRGEVSGKILGAKKCR